MAKERVNKVLARKRVDTTEEVIETMATITNQDIRVSHINFDYSLLEMEEQDKSKLVEIEKEVKFQEKQFGRVAFDIGKALYDAREIFIKSHSESFMDWYEALGLSKDQVSNFINRYKLVIDYPDKKDLIIGLADKTIKETMNKKNPQGLLERVLTGQISSAAEIKRERKNISNRFEKIQEEIEEAEVVEEDYEIKIDTQKNEIVDKVKKISKIDKVTFEKLLKIQEILKSMD